MKLDELILRPLLIYNYHPEKRQLEREFFELFQEDGDEIANIVNEVKDVDDGEAKETSGAEQKL